MHEGAEPDLASGQGSEFCLARLQARRSKAIRPAEGWDDPVSAEDASLTPALDFGAGNLTAGEVRPPLPLSRTLSTTPTPAHTCPTASCSSCHQLCVLCCSGV